MNTKYITENKSYSTNNKTKTLSPIRKGLAAIVIGAAVAGSLAQTGCYFTAKYIIQSAWPAKKIDSISGKKQDVKPDDSLLGAMGKDALIIGAGTAIYKVAEDKDSSSGSGEYEHKGHGGLTNE